jgi:hypothetical protein
MIEAGEVKQAVQQQDLDFGFQGMAEGLGLAGRRLERNRQIASQTGAAAIAGLEAGSGKGEHVGGQVLAPVVAVQLPNLGVAGEQHGNRAAGTNGTGWRAPGMPAAPLAHRVAAGVPRGCGGSMTIIFQRH